MNILHFFRISILFLLLLFIHPQKSISGQGGGSDKKEKISRLGEYSGYNDPAYKKFTYASRYLTMRDGAQIAIDVVLPKGISEDEKLPTVLYLTRYVRSLRAKWPLNLIKNPVFGQVGEDEIKFFTSHGYAVVLVDVRGSGASPGRRVMEFTPEEVKDGAEVVDWIISQPWSNKKVGSTGISYLGTTAELLLVNQHPAVVACIPRSNIYDLYNHMVFPGGVRQGPFIKVWAKTTNSLDHSDFSIFGGKAKLLVKGTNPVHQKGGKKALKAAILSHNNNFDVFNQMFKVSFRNDIHPELNMSLDNFSIHANRNAIQGSGTAIFRIGGWYDGALANSAVKGYLATDNSQRLLIGPWDHGPYNNASPFSPTKKVEFNVNNEMLRFFDYHLKGIDNGILEEEPIHYYTVGEEKWKTSSTWPIQDHKLYEYYLTSSKDLSHQPEKETSSFDYKIDYTHTTGLTTRWNSLTTIYRNGDTHYPDRRSESNKLTHFTMPAFQKDVEMTGHPVIDLYMSADATDATVFCYIEDVAPDGSVTYVTEGQFRAKHRRVSNRLPVYPIFGPHHTFRMEDDQPLEPGKPARISFDLLPISYLFKEGHTLRVAVGGADVDHFDFPEDKPTKFTFYSGEEYPTQVMLPFINYTETSPTQKR